METQPDLFDRQITIMRDGRFYSVSLDGVPMTNTGYHSRHNAIRHADVVRATLEALGHSVRFDDQTA